MSFVTSPSIQDLLAAMERGSFEDVVRMAPDCIDASPRDELVLSVWGMALLELQRPGEAAETYQTATRRFPASGLHWNNLGTALRQAGRLREAEMAYADALRREPGNAGYLVNMGFLHMEWGNVARAGDYLWEAFHRDPGNPEARIYGAQMCMDCGEDPRAHAMLDDWRRWVDRVSPELAVELGSQLIRLGNSVDGETLLRRYQDDHVCGTLARARLAVVLERINRLDEARELLDQLPSRGAPLDASLRGEVDDARAVVAMRDGDLQLARELVETRLQRADAGRSRIAALFLLAKLCDKQHDYTASMANLKLAHASQAKVLEQLVPELLAPDATPLSIANAWLDKAQVDSWQHAPSPGVLESPVFIVGFPRSGTTMLEQMLDAHPDLQSMDERAFLQNVVERMGDFGLAYPQDLGAVTDAQLEQLRETYWNAVGKVVSLRAGQRLVDKNPLNMLRLPLIVRLFPAAPIVFVVRHPCDVMLSCYMQQFRAPGFAALCSSLDSLARGYTSAMRFWFHHVELLQPRCMEWRYEHVIHDFDASVDKLAEFVQLQDAEPLRRFSEHARRKGYISTPSYSQVVKPLYADSIGHWEHYRRDFEGILPVVQPILAHWNYRG